MKIVLSKQARKYLLKQTGKTREKLDKAIFNLEELNGDIKRIGDNQYRFKIEHFQLLFSIIEDVIYIDEINTRGNIKY